MKHETQSNSETSAPVDSNAVFVRGACIAIALFARWHMSPRQALKEMQLTREMAERSGLSAFDLANLKPHWPKPEKVSGTKTRKGSRR